MANRADAEKRGRRSEALAALWLRLKGYRVLDRRIKTHAGEIDLAALAPFGPVCFIEVKARRQSRAALESVTEPQRARIARALLEFNVELRKALKAEGLLTRDARVKERKKYGQKGARKRFQFSKR